MNIKYLDSMKPRPIDWSSDVAGGSEVFVRAVSAICTRTYLRMSSSGPYALAKVLSVLRRTV
jgi:hypothetical protein